MTHSGLVDGIRLTSDHSSRDGRRVRKFIVHHAATTSLNGILSLFQPGGRTVSANYALGGDGKLICAVDEDRRAWTSSSPQDDGEAITIEVANSRSGDPWPVSDASFNVLARLIADVSERYGFEINDNTVLTHQELWARFRRSYPTACPGDLQRRKGELIALARSYRARPAFGGKGPQPLPVPKEDDMFDQDDDERLRRVEAKLDAMMEDRAASGGVQVYERVGAGPQEFMVVDHTLPPLESDPKQDGYRVTVDGIEGRLWARQYSGADKIPVHVNRDAYIAAQEWARARAAEYRAGQVALIREAMQPAAAS